MWIWHKSVQWFPRYFIHKQKLEVKDVLPNKPHAGRRKGGKMPSLSLVTLTFDLQTCLRKGPNTSTVWIWCKSVQWFARCFIHKQKTHRLTVPKTEPSAVHCVQQKNSGYIRENKLKKQCTTMIRPLIYHSTSVNKSIRRHFSCAYYQYNCPTVRERIPRIFM